MAANLQLVISGVDKASGVIKDIDKNVGGLSKTVGTVLKAGFIAAAAGMGIATFAGLKFVKAAMEEEAGIRRLAAAVDANGGSWEKQGKVIEGVIRQREKLAFSDDDLRSSLAILTAQTGDVDEALRRQTVAMDLARGANIDLGSASKLLGKVTDESHAALSRLGIVIDKDADATEVLAAVQKRFAGQSSAFADSAAGKWAQFGIQMQNLKEVIGAALLPVVTLLGGVLVDITTAAIPKVEELAKKLVDLVAPVVTDGVAILKEKLQDFVTTLDTITSSNTFKGFLDGIETGLGNVRDVAIDAKDTVVDAFGKIDEAVKKVPGLDKLTGGVADASKDAEGAKNVGKLFTEVAAGALALSIALPLLDTSINIVGNSLGGLAAGILTVALLPNPFLLALLAITALAVGLVLLEKKTQFLSKEVLPVIKDIATWVETKVIPALKEFADTELIPRLKGFGQWLESDFIPIVAHVAQVFRDDWWPVIKEVAVAVGEFLYPAFDTLHDLWVNAIEPALTGAVIPAFRVLEDVISEVVDWLSRHETVMKVTIAVLAGVAIGILLLNAPWLLVIATIIVVLAKWDEISKMFTETIPQAIDSVITKIQELPILGAIFTDTFNAIWAVVTLYIGLVLVQWEFLFATLKNTFLFWKAIFTGDWDAAWNAVKAQAEAIWNALSGSFGLALDAFQTVLTSKLEMIKSIGGQIATAIADGFKAAWNAVASSINSAIPNSLGFDIPGADLGPLGKIGGQRIDIDLPDNPIPSPASPAV